MSRLAALVAVIPLAVALLSVSAGPAAADDPPSRVSWQSAGDSFSSGEGVRGNQGACAQSDLAYGPRTADLLRERSTYGWGVTSLTFTACTGHLAEDYLNSVQVEDDDPDSSLWQWGLQQDGPEQVDVITMSFGGNDIGFPDVITDCLLFVPNDWTAYRIRVEPVVAPAARGCSETEPELHRRVDALLEPIGSGAECARTDRRRGTGYDCPLRIANGVTGSIADFYRYVVENMLTDRGQLYVVGYPQLFAPTSEWPAWSFAACNFVRRSDADMLGAVAEHLDTILSTAVDRANNRLGADRVHYLSRRDLFRTGGHELCGRGEDWLNGLANNRDEGSSVRLQTSFHPDDRGHEATADALAKLVDDTFPRPAPIVTPAVTYPQISVDTGWVSQTALRVGMAYVAGDVGTSCTIYVDDIPQFTGPCPVPGGSIPPVVPAEGTSSHTVYATVESLSGTGRSPTVTVDPCGC